MFNQVDIDKLLKGRAIVNTYRAEQSKGVDTSAKLSEDIKALGFASVGDFFKFNEDMCLDAVRKIPIYGECDFCKGYVGTPKCQTWFGNGGCAITKKPPNKEDLYQAILMVIRKGAVSYKSLAEGLNYYKEKVEVGNIYWFCTKGHGFYCKPSEVLENPLLDLRWS